MPTQDVNAKLQVEEAGVLRNLRDTDFDDLASARELTLGTVLTRLNSILTQLQAVLSVSGTVAVSGISGAVTVSNPTANPETGLAKTTDIQAVRDRLPSTGVAKDSTLTDGTQRVGGTVAVSGPVTDAQLRAAAVPVSAAALEATQANRYAGSKVPVTVQVSAAGDTTIYTPATGKAIRLFWVSAINDPDQSQSPRIVIKLGATELYRSYAIAHWEIFQGAVNQPLVCNLDQPGDVAVTVHLQEV